MISMVNEIISKIKGETYILDNNIKFLDLIYIIYKRIISLTRGLLHNVRLGKRTFKFFVGKKVRLQSKSHIYLNGITTLGDYVKLESLSKYGITFGNNVKIGDYSIISCTGSLKKLGKGIRIGDNFGCGDWCFFGAAGGIEIGNDVIMGQNVRFHSENHNFKNVDIPIRYQGVNNQGIKIGNDCWIGAGVVFLDGVTVGDGCVIGANTVVNKDIPSYSIAVGNPVKVIKSRMEI